MSKIDSSASAENVCLNGSKENLNILPSCDDTSCASVARSGESVNLNSIEIISDVCSTVSSVPHVLESTNLNVGTISTSGRTTRGRNSESAKSHVSSITQAPGIETSTSTSNSESIVQCNDEETSSTSQQMNADDDQMTKEKDIHLEKDTLKWFMSLPSGIDRAAAMATSDTSFIRTIVELSSTKKTRDAVLKHHNAHSYGGNKCQNESLGKSADTGESIEAIPLDDVIQTFKKYLPTERSFPQNLPQRNESEIIRKQSPLSPPITPIESSTNDSHNSSSVTSADENIQGQLDNNLHSENFSQTTSVSNNSFSSSCDNIIPKNITTSSSAKICDDKTLGKPTSGMQLDTTKKSTDNVVVTTLHFQSGLSLPVSGTARTKERVVRNNLQGNGTRALANKIATSYQENTDCSYEVHHQPSFQALSKNYMAVQDSEKIAEKKKKALKAVLEAKSAASRSIYPSSTIIPMRNAQPLPNAEEELLKSIRIIFSSALNIFHSANTPDEDDEAFDAEILTLDPEFLEKPNSNGKGLLFLSVANTILNKESFKRQETSRMPSRCASFLGRSNNYPVRGTLTNWPNWLLFSSESSNSSVSIALLLLGGMEISIRNAHNHYLKNRNKFVNNDLTPKTEKKNGEAINILPTIQLHNYHFDVTVKKLPLLLKSWSRLHGQKSSSAANVRQLIRCLIAMGSSNQRQRGSMTAASSFHIDDLLLVSLPFFLLFSSSCDQYLSHDAGLVNEQLQRWNGIIGQGKDYVVQALKKLDVEESAKRKSIVKEVRETEAAIRDKDTTDKLNPTNQNLDLIPTKHELNYVQENPKQSSSKKRKKNKKKKKRKGGNQSGLSGQSLVVSKNGIEASDTFTLSKNGEQNDSLSDKFTDTSLGDQNVQNEEKGKEILPDETLISQTPIDSFTEIKRNEESTSTNNTTMEQNNHSSSGSVASAISAETSKSGDSIDLPNISVLSVTKSSEIRSDIKMSLVNGVSGACVVGGGRIEDKDEVDNEVWETVEPKGGRGTGKKKNSVASNSGRNLMERQSFDGFASQSNASNITRSRNKGRTKQSRQRNMKVRMAKDVINLILDNVDDAVSQRRQTVGVINHEERRKINDERRKVSNEQNKVNASSYLAASSGTDRTTKVASLRDVLVGKGTRMRTPMPPVGPAASSSSNKSTKSIKHRSFTMQDSLNHKVSHSTSSAETRIKPSQQIISRMRMDSGTGLGQKKTGSHASADQNTAPTVPETLSGFSATTQSSCNTENDRRNVRASAVKDIEKKFGCRTAVIEGNTVQTEVTGKSGENFRSDEDDNTTGIVDVGITNTPPPLSTLLGPGNENSASSSVDSSLDAPRASRYRSYRRGLPSKEDDVGYHLLDVCERLSEDMNSFMYKRSLALRVRRRERGALLTSLQETVQNIWSGQCHVETYGSCATQLDLPSSDLDVVVCGIDNVDETNEASNRTGTNNFKNRHKNSVGSEDEGFTSNGDYDARSHENMHHHASHGHPYYHSPSKNGLRVIRLASELEMQPWAVQVKPIPTATVPVIKILADPSRLPGATAAGVDWSLQHQHMTNHSKVPTSSSTTSLNSSNTSHISSTVEPVEATNITQDMCHDNERSNGLPPMVGLHTAQSSPFNGASKPWRGHDVMNGLLSVDITFEGPEHGGIGSTAFSASVVQEACIETGLPAESTAVVQAVMVIKELLAQKRLNEPFSGGLSSYAIILLVVAVLKERRAIREEMERNERQRIAVVSESSGVTCSVSADEKNSNCHVNSSQSDNSSENTVWPVPTTSKLAASGKTKSVSAISQPGKSYGNGTNKQDDSISLSQQESQRESQGIKGDEIKIPKTVPLSSKSSWASIAMKKSVPKSASSTQLSGMKSVGSASSMNSDSVYSSQKLDLNIENNKDIVVNDENEKEPKSLNSNPTGMTEVNSGVTDLKGEKAKASPSGKEGIPPKNVSKSPLFPQGSNDVLEVLCSGETTAGKLLMHFLLFYGQLFDAFATCVDVSGKHHPEYSTFDDGKYAEKLKGFGHPHLSPFSPRKLGGAYDPITGVFSVDPIVVYDPLEGAETNNVSRSCFAWSTIRWVFAQCYVTLSGVVERGASLTSERNRNDWSRQTGNMFSSVGTSVQQSKDGSVLVTDTTQQADADGGLLELLISF